MNTKLYASFAIAALVLAACAKSPDEIPAANLGTNQYQGYSCKRLSEEKVKHTQNLASLSASQKSAASGDAWGVFLLGLPVSSMSGNDKEAAIAVAKGHINAIELAQSKRSCK